MGLKLLAGRWFDANRPVDDMPPSPIRRTRLREGALAARHQRRHQRICRAASWASKRPQDAIGKVTRTSSSATRIGMANITIIGVVGDSRFRSVRDADRAYHVP